MILLLFFFVVLLASIFLPQYVVSLLVLNLLLGLFLSLIQIAIALLPRFRPKRIHFAQEPFVSILIPAHNEPPALLMQTLSVLPKLDYTRYEVLVIDNNTRDPNVWKPVQSYARTLGEKFRFFHVENLAGFKAGALNYILPHLSRQSEYVAVIDADYVVKPNFLSLAVSHFADDKVALVQFPQQYRNSTMANQAITDEYRHFFGVYMNMANHLDCVPSTGTVSVYRKDVLTRIGGFRGEALTEDADVGLRIYAAGFRGVYVDESVGEGLMPYDLEAYKKQKWRWAFGNAQSLETLFASVGKIPVISWLGFLSHLTAWHHFHFLPFAALASFPITLLPFVQTSLSHKAVLYVAAISILITMASKFTLFWVTLRNERNALSRAARSFAAHMGLTLLYSEALLAFLFGMKSAFIRTNKFVADGMPKFFRVALGEIVLGCWYTFGFAMSLAWKNTVMALAFSLAAAALFSIYYTHLTIAPTGVYSRNIARALERKYHAYLSVL